MTLRLLLSLGLALPFLSQAQSSGTIPNLPGNAVISSYYTDADLDEMANLAPQKLEAVWYYYTRSYILEILKCDDCLPFDPAHFDINKYEHLRQKDSRRIKNDPKYGFRLTLLSTEELEYKLTIHAPQIPAENEE